MKKALAFLMAAVMLMSMLTACGNKDNADNKDNNDVSTEETDKAAADKVAALIDAIYVQERTEETDAQCEAAKAAWDALTDAQKALVEGEEASPDYFGLDTGDASKDDPRNQNEIGEKELLVVSFGTSFNDSRVADIKSIEDALQAANPDWSVRRAAMRRKSPIRGERLPNSASRSRVIVWRANLRIEMQAPSRASGGAMMLTRLPSGRRASTIGEASSMRRPTPLAMRWARFIRCSASRKRCSVACRRPWRSTKTWRGPLTMMSDTSMSSISACSGPRRTMSSTISRVSRRCSIWLRNRRCSRTLPATMRATAASISESGMASADSALISRRIWRRIW